MSTTVLSVCRQAFTGMLVIDYVRLWADLSSTLGVVFCDRNFFPYFWVIFRNAATKVYQMSAVLYHVYLALNEDNATRPAPFDPIKIRTEMSLCTVSLLGLIRVCSMCYVCMCLYTFCISGWRRILLPGMYLSHKLDKFIKLQHTIYWFTDIRCCLLWNNYCSLLDQRLAKSAQKGAKRLSPIRHSHSHYGCCGCPDTPEIWTRVSDTQLFVRSILHRSVVFDRNVGLLKHFIFIMKFPFHFNYYHTFLQMTKES